MKTIGFNAQNITRRLAARCAYDVCGKCDASVDCKDWQKLFEMSLSAIGVVPQRRSVDTVGDLVGENTLLCLLKGDGKIGAAIIGGDVVGGLIQQQTMGTISVKKTNARSMTQTYAVMCAPLLGTLFEMVAGMLDITQGIRNISGYPFGEIFEDKRALTIALD